MQHLNDPQDILDVLDQCTHISSFPVLDDGYYHLANVRLSAYSDTVYWALVIELLRSDVRMGLYDGLENSVYLFGNHLGNGSKTVIAHAEFPILGSEDDFTEEDAFALQEKWIHVNIKGKSIMVNVADVKLSTDLLYPNMVSSIDLLRYLADRYREDIFLSEQELKSLIGDQMSLMLRLSEWDHPDISNNELPSDRSTFQMIAAAIVAHDASVYSLQTLPNTHWSNWPDAGML